MRRDTLWNLGLTPMKLLSLLRRERPACGVLALGLTPRRAALLENKFRHMVGLLTDDIETAVGFVAGIVAQQFAFPNYDRQAIEKFVEELALWITHYSLPRTQVFSPFAYRDSEIITGCCDVTHRGVRARRCREASGGSRT